MTTNGDDPLEAAMSVDIANPQLYSSERPEVLWRTFRSAGRPLRLNGKFEHWAVTRYKDVEEVLRNGDRVSSELGMHLGDDRSKAAAAARAAAGKSLLVTDGPLHTTMRRAIAPAFSKRKVEDLRLRTHEIAEQLVTDAASSRPVDFVESVAAPLPAIVTCELLGVPDHDRKYVTTLTQRAFHDSGSDPSIVQLAANAELFGYCDTLVADRRRDPRADVATLLAEASADGGVMSHEAAVVNAHDLFAAGNETARHASALAALTMATHPAEWCRLRAGSVQLSDATEEVLRFGAPVSHVMRVANEDLQVGDTTIERGDLVTLWLRSANFDEEVFDHPESLQFARSPNRHLTFGLGNHFCLGAFVARMEVNAVIRSLRDIVDRVEVLESPVWISSNFLRGYRSLQVVLHRR